MSADEQNWDELKTMWREQPDAVRTMFPTGLPYTVAEGDNLSNLGEAFGMRWQVIAEATMNTVVPKEINKWLADNGGRKLASGYWAFTPGQEIQIPPPVEASKAPDFSELKTMWREQPDTAAIIFPEGLAYTIEDGDNLKRLGEAFGMPWERIAEATMGTSEPKAINAWLEANGGRKLPSGYWAFTLGQAIKIPPPDTQLAS